MSVMMLHTLCHIPVHVHVPMWYGLTIYHTIGFPWLMFSTKVTIERFLKLIQGTDMVDPTLKKL
jgi:multidrug transporter EmrE-like cation transporter